MDKISMKQKKIPQKPKGKKKKRISPMAVFAAVLAGVLAIGGLFLFSAYYMQDQGTDLPAGGEQGSSGKGEKLEKEGGPAGLIEDIISETGALSGAGEEKEDLSRYGELLKDEEAMREQKIYAKEAASEEQVVMAFAGDILFDDQYAVMAALKRQSGDIGSAFSENLLEEMQSADIFMVNNEFTYTERGTPTEGKQFTFRAKPEYAGYLLQMGVDIVSLANNHSFDYGEISLLDTLDTLEKLDMPYVGAGRNIEEAVKPVSFIINDRKITIVSATQIERQDHPNTRGATASEPGVFRCWNPERLLEETGKAKENSDYVIVYIHWGTENEAETDWAQEDQVVKIAQAGADIIIGAHPHCLQPVGFVEDVPVIYSLGNFWFNSKSVDTCLLKVVLDGEGNISVQVLPAKQEDCRTMLLEGGEKARVLSYLNSISDSAVLDDEGNMKKK